MDEEYEGGINNIMHTFKKSIAFEYIQIIIGASLVGLAYNIFYLPARLAAGGVSGNQYHFV